MFSQCLNPIITSGGGDLLAKLKHKLSYPKKASSNFFFAHPLTIPLIILALGITLTGYNLIKTIKSPNNQSASAEQLPGTPESGAKSRITELYDALVAQNKGSDTDISNLPAAQGDWGAKWNRIKTAALRGSDGGGGNNTSEDKHVEFEHNGLKWSYPLVNVGDRPTTRDGEYSTWSWDATNANNSRAARKTAPQLCQALGGNWRLPSKDELRSVYNYARSRVPQVSALTVARWSSDHDQNSNTSYVVDLFSGNFYTAYVNSNYSVACVR